MNVPRLLVYITNLLYNACTNLHSVTSCRMGATLSKATVLRVGNLTNLATGNDFVLVLVSTSLINKEDK